MVNFKIWKKVDQANSVTMRGVQRELGKVKKEMKTMRMGPVPGMADETKLFTEEEQRQHVRSNRAIYNPQCELCVQTRGLARHPKQIETESVDFDYATVKNSEGNQVHTLLFEEGPRGETFARRAPPRKGAKIDDLEKLLETTRSRCGQILCVSDQEECFAQMVRPVALKLGLPLGTSPAELPQANGRAEQKVRSVKERAFAHHLRRDAEEAHTDLKVSSLDELGRAAC